MPDGRLFVFYRSAYGNWTHGVAPLVALGVLDLAANHIELLSHAHGMRPPWNTFWGTADESQNFLIAGDTVLIVHQGTLSGFDLRTKKLLLISGKRDTWGGFHNLPWARNEWHGPARGGVAVVANRIYWQTGSRILCIAAGEKGEPAVDTGIDGDTVPTHGTVQATRVVPDRAEFRDRLRAQIDQFLAKRWAPLTVQPGLAGREFIFDSSGDVFEALAWAFPHLDDERRKRVKTFLAKEWTVYPPFTREAWYPVNGGARRELFWTPEQALERFHADRPPHEFGNVYAVWLYAQRCGEWDRVAGAWQQLSRCFRSFVKSKWTLDPTKGDLHANRYLASLIAFGHIAEKTGHAEGVREVRSAVLELADTLAAWWQHSAERSVMPTFRNIKEWDSFIRKGDGLLFKVVSHRAKIALFQDLTPEVAGLIKARAPDASATIWRTFETLCPTWHLAGEERQVHFGENFVDPPGFALGAFRALASLRDASFEELASRVDIPFCRADLAYVTKLALALER